MHSQIDLVGASREVYRYRLAEGGEPRIRTGGAFVYVRSFADREPEVIYAGQTDNLMTGVTELWSRAVAEHGATHIFTRLTVSGAERRQQLRDIVEGLKPVMNDCAPSADAPEPAQAAADHHAA